MRVTICVLLHGVCYSSLVTDTTPFTLSILCILCVCENGCCQTLTRATRAIFSHVGIEVEQFCVCLHFHSSVSHLQTSSASAPPRDIFYCLSHMTDTSVTGTGTCTESFSTKKDSSRSIYIVACPVNQENGCADVNKYTYVICALAQIVIAMEK